MNNISTEQLKFLTLINSQSNEHYKEIVTHYITICANEYVLEMNLLEKDKERAVQLNMKEKNDMLLDKEREFQLNMKDKENDNEKLKIQRLKKEIELIKLKNI